MAKDVRRVKNDRRAKQGSDDEEDVYDGPERRSGQERRIWVDRVQETKQKMTQKQN